MAKGANAAILATRPDMAQARALQWPLTMQGFRRAPSGRNLASMDERGKRAEKMRQQRRLGAALRENLKRRKVQAKARAGSSDAVRAAKSHDSAGIVGLKQER